MLIANVRGHTFFTCPYPIYDQLQVVINQLKHKEFKPVVEQYNMLAPIQDHAFLRQLYQILLLPAEIIEPVKVKSKKSPAPKPEQKESILKYSLHNQKLLFKQVL